MSEISTNQLTVLENLYMEKREIIKKTIGSWSLNDVKDQTAFQASVDRLKRQVLLTPVNIGTPAIEPDNIETRNIPLQHRMFGGPATMQILTVTYPVTGSKELFHYRANNTMLPMGNLHVPSGSNIRIRVEVPELDKAQILDKANDHLSITKELIRQNNPDAEAWSLRTGTEIDSMAAQRRKELIDLFK